MRLAPEEVAAICSGFKAGASTCALAERHGRHLETIQRVLRQTGMRQPGQRKSQWPIERDERLRELWDQGLTASEIATCLKEVSRCAVIARARRLGLAGRAGVQKPGPKPKAVSVSVGKPDRRADTGWKERLDARRALRPVVAATKRRDAFPAPDDPAPHERVSLLNRKAWQCKFPLGDPKHADFGYCGRRQKAGAPYCADHCKRAYAGGTSVPARRDRKPNSSTPMEMSNG